MKISELEKRSGINAHTLRYYEKSGLLKASMRSDKNYRIYSEEDLVAALFIQHCKKCGFSLSETAALLAIKHDKSQHVCAEAKQITVHKLEDITSQISRLQEMKRTLTQLQEYCCGGQESAEFCSIISMLEAGN
ncbi:MerR family transcriptional regulator [Paraglaciecola sp.]|uniref:MerR family transcriptional regulator n=1 Tax=Paraglaciecola sp. TaxID=1920173 RepID=UPI003EF59FF0